MATVSFADAIAMYGALAGVAAITTALQALVALVPLSQVSDVEQRKNASGSGTAPYNIAKADAKKYMTGAILLNVPAALVNAAVIIAWGYVVLEVIPNLHPYLVLPFGAVCAAWLYLVIVAVIGVARLNNAR